MKFSSTVAYAALAAGLGHALPTEKRNVATTGDITTSDGFPAKRDVLAPTVLDLIKRNVATSDDVEKRNVATSDVETRNVGAISDVDARNVGAISVDNRNVATSGKRNVGTSEKRYVATSDVEARNVGAVSDVDDRKVATSD